MNIYNSHEIDESVTSVTYREQRIRSCMKWKPDDDQRDGPDYDGRIVLKKIQE